MKSLNGIFLNASEEELTLIWHTCALNGLEQSSDGVLKLLLMLIEDDEEEEEVETQPLNAFNLALEHLKQNPEQAAALKAAGEKLFGNVMRKFRK